MASRRRAPRSGVPHPTATGGDSLADDSNEFALAIYSELRRPLRPDTRLLLVSAVYFKGSWEKEFEIDIRSWMRSATGGP